MKTISSSSENIKHQRNILLMMSFIPILFISILFLVLYVGNRMNAGAEPPSPTSGKQWNLVFSDEFNDTSLDLRKWQPNWLGPSNTAATKPVNSAELSCYHPDQLKEAGGTLIFTVEQKLCSTPHGTYSYASGLINSRKNFTFTYGYLEARMWIAPGEGPIYNWPAFWANGTGTWPTTGELDVFEGYGGDASYHFHSPSGGPGAHVAQSNPSGWHTYGAKWESGVVTYYYDNQQVGRITSGITDSPMYLIANLGISSSLAPPVIVPSTMKLDYVRVYQLADAPASAPTSSPSPNPEPAPIPTSVPSQTPPSDPELPPQQLPTVSIPGGNLHTPVKIPKKIVAESDGSIIGDFNGDGVNEVVKDINEDGKIDPLSEVINNDFNSSIIPSDIALYKQNLREVDRTDTFIVKAGPFPEVNIPKPIGYLFITTGGLSAAGLSSYLLMTKLAIFAVFRNKWGL